MTPDVDPERNDILWLEGGVQASSDDPERNDILRLDEVKRRKSMLINTYCRLNEHLFTIHYVSSKNRN